MNEMDGDSLTSEYFSKTTCHLIPDGVQTLSKMPSKHIEGVYPIWLAKGKGAHVWDVRGKEYIDYPCGLGSILLGYSDPRVNRAVHEQLEEGVIFSLPHPKETQLAQKIIDMIPCAEMVRFLKTGSEACSAAVRIARAYTGKEGIIACGYHGWHDWYNWTTTKNKGVPKQKTVQLKYNDLDAFADAIKKRKLAAVIIEPYVLNPPDDQFFAELRKLCTSYNVLLIFDEVVTGFRTLGFSAQSFFKVTPDLACFGKAMANGLPISFVCGKQEIMKELEGDCFVSSTFGGELLSIAAALATLDIVEREEVPGQIWRTGNYLISQFNDLVRALSMEGVECIGYPPRTFFKFPTELHKSLFWQECCKRGVLFGYAQFICQAHGQMEIDRTMEVAADALRHVRRYWDKPENALEGKPAQETFRLVTT